jgi:hypothetical protein
MRERYASGSDMLIAVNAVLDALAFDTHPAGVDPFEQAVADLGRTQPRPAARAGGRAPGRLNRDR